MFVYSSQNMKMLIKITNIPVNSNHIQGQRKKLIKRSPCLIGEKQDISYWRVFIILLFSLQHQSDSLKIISHPVKVLRMLCFFPLWHMKSLFCDTHKKQHRIMQIVFQVFKDVSFLQFSFLFHFWILVEEEFGFRGKGLSSSQ